MPDPLTSRVARAADVDLVTRTISLAFANDPVWGPAMGGAGTSVDQKAAIWRIFIGGAVRYPWSRIVGDGEAVAIWIPPGGNELTESEQARLEATVGEILPDDVAADYHALAERFEANHPHDTPHAYLSLLAVHPEQRGRGIGMALLADDLRRLDADHVPAWLESTNPANDRRYAGIGFEPVGQFWTVDGERPITTMWRAAR